MTGDDGTFRLEDVPPGTYTLQAWQEELGASDQTVTVQDGQTVSVDFTFSAKSASGKTGALSLPVQEVVIAAAGHE